MDPEFIRDLFQRFRPVSLRRMFSGAAISVDGVTFALVIRGMIYLKVDETSIPAFEQEGSQPFTYTRAKGPRGNKPIAMSYWRLPERLYDDPDELAQWAERAFDIAQRQKRAAAVRKPLPRRARGKGDSPRRRPKL